jgi:hypothetical protein
MKVLLPNGNWPYSFRPQLPCAVLMTIQYEQKIYHLIHRSNYNPISYSGLLPRAQLLYIDPNHTHLLTLINFSDFMWTEESEIDLFEEFNNEYLSHKLLTDF